MTPSATRRRCTVTVGRESRRRPRPSHRKLTYRRQQPNKGRARSQHPLHRAQMRCCPSRQCRNDRKKHRSTWMRLIWPRARLRPQTRARRLLMYPQACRCPRKQARRRLGFARDANKDAQRGWPPGGARSKRLRSAEMQGKNLSFPAFRLMPHNIFLRDELDVPSACFARRPVL